MQNLIQAVAIKKNVDSVANYYNRSLYYTIVGTTF